MYATFIDTVHKLYDKSFPMRTIVVKAPELHKPWLTAGIKNSITKKLALYISYQTLKSNESLTAYKAYRIKLSSILRKPETMFYLKN